MEHHDKKTLLPGFPPTGFQPQFTAIPNNGANSLMSTLQSLQMHSLGNGILPTANIAGAEYQQRMLLEQMQQTFTMYNSFGLKQDGLQTNGTQASSSTIFPTAQSLFGQDFNQLAPNPLVERHSHLMDEAPRSSTSSHNSSTPHEIDVVSTGPPEPYTSSNMLFHPTPVRATTTTTGFQNSDATRNIATTFESAYNTATAPAAVVQPVIQPTVPATVYGSQHTTPQKQYDNVASTSFQHTNSSTTLGFQLAAPTNVIHQAPSAAVQNAYQSATTSNPAAYLGTASSMHSAFQGPSTSSTFLHTTTANNQNYQATVTSSTSAFQTSNPSTSNAFPSGSLTTGFLGSNSSTNPIFQPTTTSKVNDFQETNNSAFHGTTPSTSYQTQNTTTASSTVFPETGSLKNSTLQDVGSSIMANFQNTPANSIFQKAASSLANSTIQDSNTASILAVQNATSLINAALQQTPSTSTDTSYLGTTAKNIGFQEPIKPTPTTSFQPQVESVWQKPAETIPIVGTTTEIARPIPINAASSSIPSTSSIPTTSASENSTYPTASNSTANIAVDNDIDIQVDVDDIFGLAFEEDNLEPKKSKSLFGLPTMANADGSLSPVQFTPPDSPAPMETAELLFGFGSRTNSTPTSVISQPSTSTAVPDNEAEKSNDVFKVPEVPGLDSSATATPPLTAAITPSPKKDSIPIYARKEILKSSKVPVYKQKLNLLKMEKKSISKDAFEFEDDDEEISLGPKEQRKETSDVISNCDTKSKNVYVPGIGFAITNEAAKEQKPAPAVKKSITDSRPVVPNATAPEIKHVVDPSFVTLAESIRIRRNQRLTCSFLKPSLSNESDCPRNMSITKRRPDQQPLPKMVIRVNNIYENNEGPLLKTPQKRKRRKKKDSDDEEDSDWDEAVENNRGRRKKTVQTVYSLHYVDPSKETDHQPDYFSQQQRNKANTSMLRSNKSKDGMDSVEHRLSKFGSAEGFLPKGTYVVCKADLMKDDCALWRVDNQNLLQKFPPRMDLHSSKLIYKSSSTYSGWCEQISSQYFRVAVKVLKQSRSETTIEPDIPLADLFPAMSTEVFNTPRTFFVPDPMLNIDDAQMLRDSQRIALNTMMMALINHALTMDYLQILKEKNDWTFCRSAKEIDQLNASASVKIDGRVKIADNFKTWVKEYTRINVVRTEYHSITLCQVCGRKKCRKIIYLFDRQSYDRESLHFNFNEDVKDEDEPKEELPTIDIYSCGRCTKAIEFMHRIEHMRLHMMRCVEDKLEALGTEHVEMAPEKIVELIKRDKAFICNVIIQCCELWRSVGKEYD